MNTFFLITMYTYIYLSVYFLFSFLNISVIDVLNTYILRLKKKKEIWPDITGVLDLFFNISSLF